MHHGHDWKHRFNFTAGLIMYITILSTSQTTSNKETCLLCATFEHNRRPAVGPLLWKGRKRNRHVCNYVFHSVVNTWIQHYFTVNKNSNKESLCMHAQWRYFCTFASSHCRCNKINAHVIATLQNFLICDPILWYSDHSGAALLKSWSSQVAVCTICQSWYVDHLRLD